MGGGTRRGGGCRWKVKNWASEVSGEGEPLQACRGLFAPSVLFTRSLLVITSNY